MESLFPRIHYKGYLYFFPGTIYSHERFVYEEWPGICPGLQHYCPEYLQWSPGNRENIIINFPEICLPCPMHFLNIISWLTLCPGPPGADPPGQGQWRRADGAGGEQVRPRGREGGGQGPGAQPRQAVQQLRLHGDLGQGEDRSQWRE